MAVDELIKLLSTAFRKDQDSNNYKLLKVVDSEFTNIEQTINDIKNAHFVDLAQGKSLDYIASLFNVRRKQNESDDHFRARIKLAFSKITDMTTINDIKEMLAATIQTETSRIKVMDKWDSEPALFFIYLFMQDLNNAGINIDELRELIKLIKPTGVKVQAFQLGTFTYRSAGEASDPTKGYNDLSNSNPDGGTYAGLI